MKPHGYLLAVSAATLVIGASISFGTGRPKKTDVHGVSWYDSLEVAKVEAKRTKKPILLLSMFGRIDEEMPCANARTLRATLFKDPRFKKLVTKEVVPAWEMVREVPRVTIDLGDGKKVVRTVRGNAVMYLCNSNGYVIDAFPGVYTAEDFLPEVRKSIVALHNKPWSEVAAYHKPLGFVPRRSEITTGKAMLESPTLKLVGSRWSPEPSNTILRTSPSLRAEAKPPQPSNDEARKTFLLAAERLSDMSLLPMSSGEAYRRITGKNIGKTGPGAANEIMAEDSRRNMTSVRGVIHLWLASETRFLTPMEAREPVLETILKIPYKDPYFGLKDVLLPGTPN